MIPPVFYEYTIKEPEFKEAYRGDPNAAYFEMQDRIGWRASLAVNRFNFRAGQVTQVATGLMGLNSAISGGFMRPAVSPGGLLPYAGAEVEQAASEAAEMTSSQTAKIVGGGRR